MLARVYELTGDPARAAEVARGAGAEIDREIPETVAGLLWCTLSRPAFTVLLPSLWLMLMISEKNGRQKILEGLGFLVTCAIGLSVVAYTQFNETGAWGGFYSAQSGYGNTPSLPAFPLTSWGGGAIVPITPAWSEWRSHSRTQASGLSVRLTQI